jgi:hypothetical protein
VQSLLANMPPGTTQADVARALQLVITEDDVVAMRSLLTSPTAPMPSGKPRWQSAPVAKVYDGVLQASPATVKGVPYSSVAQLQTALNGGLITQAEFEGALLHAGAAAAGKVTGAGFTSGQGPELAAGRTALGSDPQAIRLMGAGEYTADVHLGSGRAIGGAGARGGAVGGLVAVAVEGGVILYDPAAHPNAARDLGTAGGLGFLGGGTGMAAEQATASALTRGAVASGTAMTTAGAAGLRGVAGGAGGGVGAVFVEWAKMALEERETPMTGAEFGLRTGRSGGIGVASGAGGAVAGGVAGTIASSALAGTALGSAVPGLGNAVGFLVGLAVGVAIAYALEEALPKVPQGY